VQATLGSDVVATLVAPSVLPTFPVGARIEVPVTHAIVSYWRAAAYDPVTGRWTVVLDSPLSAGEYNLVWRDGGPEPPEFEVFIPLSVVRAGAAAAPVGGPYSWAPTPDEVATFTPAYTRGGFDDDRIDAGAEQATFTDQTTPNVDAVAALIVSGCDEIAGRVVVGIPPGQEGLAKVTAIWYVKAMIAADKQPAGTDDASGEYRGAIARYLANLEQLIVASRAGTAPRLH
jgi:hypothetical protein